MHSGIMKNKERQCMQFQTLGAQKPWAFVNFEAQSRAVFKFVTLGAQNLLAFVNLCIKFASVVGFAQTVRTPRPGNDKQNGPCFLLRVSCFLFLVLLLLLLVSCIVFLAFTWCTQALSIREFCGTKHVSYTVSETWCPKAWSMREIWSTQCDCLCSFKHLARQSSEPS